MGSSILCVRLENAYSRPEMGFWGDFIPRMGNDNNATQKGRPLRGNTS